MRTKRCIEQSHTAARLQSVLHAQGVRVASSQEVVVVVRPSSSKLVMRSHQPRGPSRGWRKADRSHLARVSSRG